jgi:hypothetical protein
MRYRAFCSKGVLGQLLSTGLPHRCVSTPRPLLPHMPNASAEPREGRPTERHESAQWAAIIGNFVARPLYARLPLVSHMLQRIIIRSS